MLGSDKLHSIGPFPHVHASLEALVADEVDLESLLADSWIKAHPDYVSSTAVMRR